MPRSPKVASRQTRRETRKRVRENRQVYPGAQIQPTFMDTFTRAPAKGLHKPVVPLNKKQEDYSDLIGSSRVTFGIGPAGTGKTYFATMVAAEALFNQEIEKIYLTRPAVEAGETLGFLPGSIEEKYEPYLRPFKEALVEFFGASHLEYLIKRKMIEPVPLGFLRGATIKNAWLLGDEMQNATKEQMKMLLTRMGKDSKFLINGDPRQSDIGSSGLMDAVRRASSISDVSVIEFTRDDVVRDDIVAEFLRVYED